MNTLEVLVCEGLEREVVVAECLADVLFSGGPLVASDEVGKVRDVFGAEEGSREALVLAEAREDITPPIIAMPIVPGVVLVGVRAPLQTR